MADTICSSSDEEEILTYKLKIHDADISDAGKWLCEVKDKYGSVSTACDINIYEEAKRQSITSGRDVKAIQNRTSANAVNSDSEEEILTYRLKIHDANSKDAGKWKCEVKDKYGSASTSCNLDVFDNQLNQDLEAPKFLMTLRDMTTLEGQSLKLICRVRGTPLPKIAWYRNGEPVSKDDYSYQVLYLRDGTISLELFHPKPETDAAVFKCEAQNEKGVVTTHCKVTVVHTKRGESLSRDHLLNFSMYSRARSETRAASESRMSTRAASETRYAGSSSVSRLSKRLGDYYLNGKSTTWNYSGFNETDSGIYNIYQPGYSPLNFLNSQEKDEPELKLKMRWSTDEDLYFQENLKNKCVLEGSRLYLSAYVIGKLPIFVQWYKDGKPLLKNVYERHIVRSRAGHLSLEVPLTELEDSGNYLVDVRNEQGRMNSACYIQIEPRYRYKSDFEKPTFLEGIHHVHVNEGQTATFQVVARGNPQPGITWFKDAKRIQMTAQITIHTGVKGGSILNIHNCEFSDMGLYKAEAHNYAGRCSGSAKLTVFESGTRFCCGEDGDYKIIKRRYSVENGEEGGEDVTLSSVKTRFSHADHSSRLSKYGSRRETTLSSTSATSTDRKSNVTGLDEVDIYSSRSKTSKKVVNGELENYEVVSKVKSSKVNASCDLKASKTSSESSMTQKGEQIAKTDITDTSAMINQVKSSNLESTISGRIQQGQSSDVQIKSSSDLLTETASKKLESATERSQVKTERCEVQSSAAVTESKDLSSMEVKTIKTSVASEDLDQSIKQSMVKDVALDERSEVKASQKTESANLDQTEGISANSKTTTELASVGSSKVKSETEETTSSRRESLRKQISEEALVESTLTGRSWVMFDNVDIKNGKNLKSKSTKNGKITNGDRISENEKIPGQIRKASLTKFEKSEVKVSDKNSSQKDVSNVSSDITAEKINASVLIKDTDQTEKIVAEKKYEVETSRSEVKGSTNGEEVASSVIAEVQADMQSGKATGSGAVLDQEKEIVAKPESPKDTSLVDESVLTKQTTTDVNSEVKIPSTTSDEVDTTLVSSQLKAKTESSEARKSVDEVDTSVIGSQLEAKTESSEVKKSVDLVDSTVISSQLEAKSESSKVKKSVDLVDSTVISSQLEAKSESSEVKKSVDEVDTSVISSQLEAKTESSEARKSVDEVDTTVISSQLEAKTESSEVKKSVDEVESTAVSSQLEAKTESSEVRKSVDEVEITAVSSQLEAKTESSEVRKSTDEVDTTVISSQLEAKTESSEVRKSTDEVDTTVISSQLEAKTESSEVRKSVDEVDQTKEAVELKSDSKTETSVKKSNLETELTVDVHLENKNERMKVSAAEETNLLMKAPADTKLDGKIENSEVNVQANESDLMKKEAVKTESETKNAVSESSNLDKQVGQKTESSLQSSDQSVSKSVTAETEVKIQSSEVSSVSQSNTSETKTEEIQITEESSQKSEQKISKVKEDKEMTEKSLIQSDNMMGTGTEAEILTEEDNVIEEKETIYTTPPNIVKYLPKLVELKDGETVNLQCLVSGEPKPKVVWLHNSKKITSEMAHISLTSKAEYHNLEILEADFVRDSGTYTLRASNISGEKESHCEVKIEGSVKKLKLEEEKKDSKVEVVLEAEEKRDSKMETEMLVLEANEEKKESKKKTEILTAEKKTIVEMDSTRVEDKVDSLGFDEKTDLKVDVIESKEGISSKKVISVEEEKQISIKTETTQVESSSISTKTEKEPVNEPVNESMEVMEVSTVQTSTTCLESSPSSLKKENKSKEMTGSAFFEVPLHEEYHAMERDEDFRLYVKVGGEPNSPAQWFKDGEELEQTRRVLINWDTETQESTVVIRRFKVVDAGVYQCVVLGDKGPFSTKTVLHLVRLESQRIESNVPLDASEVSNVPVILYPIKDTRVYKGQEAYFESAVDKRPDIKVKWFKDGTDITNRKRKYLFKENRGVYSLTVEDVQDDDCGSYTFEVTSDEGVFSISANIILEVEKNKSIEVGPPKVITQPDSIVSVPVDGVIVLKCCAEANPPAKFQWQKDMVDIMQSPRVAVSFPNPGESTLTISDVTYNDRGMYVCVVKNRLGRVKTRCNLHVGVDISLKDKKKAKPEEVDFDKSPEEEEKEAIIKSEEDENARIATKEAENPRIAAEETEKAGIAAKEADKTRISAEEAEKAKIVAEEAEKARIAAEEADKTRISAEEAKKAKIAAEEAVKARIAAIETEKAKIAAEETEKARIAAEEAEKARTSEETASSKPKKKRMLTFEEAEKQRLEAESAEAVDNEETKIVEEAEKVRIDAEEAKKARIAAEAEMARVAAEEAEKTKIAAEAEKARIAVEEAEKAKIAAEGEKARIAAEEAEKARIAVEEAKKAKIAAEAEKARIAVEEAEKAKIAAEGEKARIAAEEAEKARIAVEEAKKAKIAAEEAEKAKIAAEEAEKARIAAEEIQKATIAAEETERARIAAEESEKARTSEETNQSSKPKKKHRLTFEEAEKQRLEADSAEAADNKEAKIAAEEAEKSRIAAEEAEKARIAAEEAEKAKIAAEAEKARIAAEEAEKAKIAAEAEKAKITAEEAEKARIAAEEAEKAKISAEEAEKAKISAEEAEKAKIAAEADKAKIAAEEAEKAKIAAEEAEKARIAAEETEKAKIAAEETERARIAAEEAKKARTSEETNQSSKPKKKHRLTFEEAEKQRLEADSAEAADNKEAKIAAEEAEKARIAAEEAEKARIAAEEAEKARIAEEDEEKARIAAAEVEKARIAAEEAEKTRIAAEAENARIVAEETEKARIAAEETERTRIAAEEAEKAETSEETNQSSKPKKKHRLTFEEAEKQRLEADSAEAADNKEAKIAAEEAEKARIAAEEEEKAQIAAEETEKARIVAEEEEKAKFAAEEAKKARIAAEEEEKARIVAEEEGKARIAVAETERIRIAEEAGAESKLISKSKKKHRLTFEEAEKLRFETEKVEKLNLNSEISEQTMTVESLNTVSIPDSGTSLYSSMEGSLSQNSTSTVKSVCSAAEGKVEIKSQKTRRSFSEIEEVDGGVVSKMSEFSVTKEVSGNEAVMEKGQISIVSQDSVCQIDSTQQDVASQTRHQLKKRLSADGSSYEILEVSTQRVTKTIGEATTAPLAIAHHHVHHPPEIIRCADSKRVPTHSELEITVRVRASKHAKVSWVHDGETVSFTGKHYELITEEEPLKE